MRFSQGAPFALTADPAGFEEAFAATARPEVLWRLVIETSSEADLAVYRDEIFAEFFRRSLDEGFRQGVGGYARDLALTFGPWRSGWGRSLCRSTCGTAGGTRKVMDRLRTGVDSVVDKSASGQRGCASGRVAWRRRRGRAGRRANARCRAR